MQKGTKKKKEKKRAIALLQSGSYKTIKQRGKKDNPILKWSLKVRFLSGNLSEIHVFAVAH